MDWFLLSSLQPGNCLISLTSLNLKDMPNYQIRLFIPAAIVLVTISLLLKLSFSASSIALLPFRKSFETKKTCGDSIPDH